MEFSDDDEEIIDLNTIKDKSKDKKDKDKIKLTKSMKWVRSSLESISQIVRSELEELEYSDDRNVNKFGDNGDFNEEKIFNNINYGNNDNNDKNNQNENNDNNNDDNDNDNYNEQNDEEFSDINSNKNMYTFIWDEGGNNVKLIGSFSNWKHQLEMEKDEKDQKYKLSIPLNNEKYQYKFIVDGVWKYSKKQNMIDDGKGNINNILDLTNIKKKKNEKKKSSKKIKKKSNKNMNNENEMNDNDELNIKKEKNKNVKNKVYGNVFPDAMKMGEPEHSDIIGKSFNINNETKQRKIGIIKYYKFVPNNSFSSLKSYLNISSYRHTMLNHIIFQKKIKKNKDIKYGISFRYREKATTFIYYKSNSKK